MFLPVLYVNIRNATNKKLQFSFIKDINKIRRYKLVEAGDESIELLLYSLLDSPFRDEAIWISAVLYWASQNDSRGILNVFLLIVVRYFNISTVRF